MSEPNAEFINELTQTLEFTVTAEYPSQDSGFNIVNILSSKFEDESFPSPESPTGNGSKLHFLNSMLAFIFVYLNMQ